MVTIRNTRFNIKKNVHADYIKFMCYVWISEETVTFVLYTVKSLVFITAVDSVYCAVRGESFYKTDKFRP